MSRARKPDRLGLARVQQPSCNRGCESESLGFSASLTGIGLCLPFNSKDEDIPTYVKYPLEVTSEFWTLSEREDDNAFGRNMDADRGNQIGKLFYSFTHVGYGCLGTSQKSGSSQQSRFKC